MSSDEQEFFSHLPDYAVAPGEHLDELLEMRGLSQAELAERTGLSPGYIKSLLKGLVPLTARAAELLEQVTGVPARFWNRLEANYRANLERLRGNEEDQ